MLRRLAATPATARPLALLPRAPASSPGAPAPAAAAAWRSALSWAVRRALSALASPADPPSMPPKAQPRDDDAPADAADIAAASPPKAKKRPRAAAGPSPHVLNSLAQLQTKAAAIAEALGRLYPDPPIPLDHGSPFQLLCAVVLSAQTTDKKVNEVTPGLFALAPDAAAMAAIPVPTIAAAIRTLGLAPTKAKNLQALSAELVERHGGAVPDTFEALEALPGVGHKTASVVMAQVHGADAFPVDTHIHRLAQRWGLTSGRSVEQTEADLKAVFPATGWRDLHLQIIFFGREKCPARGHDPSVCPICCWAAVPPYDKPGNSPLKPGQRAGGGAAGGGGGGKAKRRLVTESESEGGDPPEGVKRRGRKPKAAAAEPDGDA